MAKHAYINRTFSLGVMQTIRDANGIIDDYMAQGFRLTLRQLYYQFVARDLIANKQTEYKRLGDILSNARLAGLVDWDAIEDRGRNMQQVTTWDRPSSILDAVANQYREDFWRAQPFHVEAWIEKEALVGVIAGVCNRYRMPYFACKGYVSQSEMRDAAISRLLPKIRANQEPVILHLGDHDPSGIDMTRDIRDRLSLFCGQPVQVRRLALNWGQVEEYNPPPNPAKVTDSRFNGYVSEYGAESWELDALEPPVLSGLIEAAVKGLIDWDVWKITEREEEIHRERLVAVRDQFQADGE